ncbi:NUDIX hydrolase [Kribbella qitaiheensis]|uniref:NUDIX hydrolase n=1 Tax=Kribbella qitaiheensis TaxID=1544730 RepID=A0A7G6X1X5_9ACTN|nr:NUDIX domain-containing protein [Kribbella qitaiheensis]QNE20240.1 NUDIX hydrolase [Kribbella qitaiheensis]
MVRDLKSQLLSGRMAAEALGYTREGRTPVEPRPASTVILLRDTATGPEVYLLRRQQSMAFAAGMTVFPGGRVDPTDSSIADSWSGPSPASFGERLGCSADTAAAYVAAAVRETFEESGVLLAGTSTESVVEDTTGDDWEADRVALESRELGFADFLHRRGLVLRADLLGAWTHWITPEFEPRRYDTAFFVAALPAGQVTRDVTSESDQVAWLRPADAVRAVEAGEMLMLPPTYLCCSDLSSYDTVADALAASAHREIPTIEPTIRVEGDLVYLETT